MGDRVYKIRLLLPSVYVRDLSFNEEDTPESVESLTSYLQDQGRNLSNEQRINLLLQIDHCLLCLHKGNTACSPLSISKITILNNLNRDILANSTDCGEAAKQDDIRQLANVYCCILTGGRKCTFTAGVSEEDILCSDRYISLDILEKLENGDLSSIDSVLRHPFHWSDLKRVYFICRATDYISERHLKKASETKKQRILERYNMGYVRSVVTRNGWIGRLKMSGSEIMQINRGMRWADVPISVNTIFNLGVKPASTKDDREKSVFELARFFRNRYIHYQEDDDNVRKCFESYPSGYFKFFSKRFPKFFTHVYNNMNPFVSEEFADVESHVEFPHNVQLSTVI